MIVEHIEPGIESPNLGALRTTTFRHLLTNAIGPAEGRHLVDLGAGHCKFSAIAQEYGFQVTAVDARDERVPSGDLGDIRFELADVRHYDISNADVVAVLGLLYHLTLADQIDLLGRIVKSGAQTVIDTQIHVPELIVQTENKGGWQDKVVAEGHYRGIVFTENNNPMASVGNATSWWHLESSMLQLLEDVGFQKVVVVEPAYVSKYGGRKWFVAS